MQATTILCSVAMVIGVGLLLRLTGTGKAIRAVASDRSLAWTSGVDVDRILLWTYLLAALLASISAILIGIDTDLTPAMGMPALLIAVIVCVIGGKGYVLGTVVAAFLIASGQQIGIWVIGSQWQDAIAFIILGVTLVDSRQITFGLVWLVIAGLAAIWRSGGALGSDGLSSQSVGLYRGQPSLPCPTLTNPL